MPYPSAKTTLALARQFDPGDDERSARSKRETLRLLEEPGAPFDRTTFDPGHITASGVVVAPDGRQVLLVYHKKLGRWLQPGGHCEPTDAEVWATAQRELLEETGIDFQNAAAWPLVGIDVHDIPRTNAEPAHRHHDLCFFVQATACQMAATQALTEVSWCPIRDLDRCGVDAPLRTCLERALHVTL